MAPFGLIETLRAVDGVAPLLVSHQRRLARSWPEFFRGRAPALSELAAEAIAASRRKPALVRVAFVGERGGKPRVEVESRALPAVPRRIAVAIAASPRRGPRAARRHKSADRSWIDELAVAGTFETLVWDDEGGLLEGTRSNLFVLAGGELSTPPVGLGLVPGVVRELVLEAAASCGVRPRERPLSPADLRGADGLLLTGSGVGIVAVDECDGRTIERAAAAALARRLSPRLRTPG
jgi:branched-subunit amino acid aminotransferase/4-amino-4-deoxychorismate lyase